MIHCDECDSRPTCMAEGMCFHQELAKRFPDVARQLTPQNLKRRFRPRVFFTNYRDWRLGGMIAWEWDTPAVVVWFVFIGIRIGFDWE